MTKAQQIFWLSQPDVPSFPLSPDILAEVKELPGTLPTSIEEFVQTLATERMAREAPATPVV